MKLRQLSKDNTVIYRTHSHYLLDPEVIPLSSIRVAEKDSNGNVRLLSIHEHSGSILERQSAFQPIVDALEIKPFLFDLTDQRVVIVEGICDFYAMEMFKGSRDVRFLPSVGADSIPYYVSLMIAWRIDYRAVWDNDAAGLAAKSKAERIFGAEESGERFFDLSVMEGVRILQDLFAGSDITFIKGSLGLRPETGFEKVIALLFYSSKRLAIIDKVSTSTRRAFERLYTALALN